MPDCIYLRKSRQDAEAEAAGAGETLARHEQALLQNAKRLGRSITHIYREVVSGETISARPQMQQLLRDVESGAWEGVHVMEVERLARGDTLDQGIVSQAFLYSKTLIHTPQKTYDPTNEFDEEYFEFGLFMSRREYKTINRRQQAGRIASMREGKWVANKAPYGYRRVKLEGQKGWTLEPHEEEAAVVRDVFRWASDGYTDEHGQTQRLGVSLIVRRLNDLGIPSPAGIDWIPGSVRELLKNEAYIGKIRWGHRPGKKVLQDGVVVMTSPRIAVGEYQTFDGLHAPLVDADTYNRVQALLAGYPSRPGPKQAVTKNPLAGILTCGSCGRAMVRRPYQSGRQETLLCPYTNCKTMASDLNIVETVLLATLGDLLRELELPAQEKQPKEKKEIESLQRALAAADRELSTLAQQEKRAFELVEQNVYTVDQFLARSQDLTARKQDLQDKQTELSAQLQSHQQATDARQSLAPQLRHVLEAYRKTPSPADKNALLRSVLTKVIYTKTTGGRYKDSNMQLTLYPRL